MRAFVLGATGWIGGAITDALLSSHHQVIGLTRHTSAFSALETRGVSVVQGDLDEHEALLPGAQQADAIIVASKASRRTTVATLGALISILQGSHKPLVYISGSSVYGDIGNLERVEEDLFVQHLSTPEMDQSPEQIVSQAQEHGVHGMILVGAGVLYGRGSGATPTFLLEDASRRHVAWYIHEGTQRCSVGYVEDLARLSVLAVEHLPSSCVFNAVAEVPSLREVAELIAQSISERTAQSEWGSFWTETLSHNLWLSSTRAESILGWKPQAASFKDDLLSGPFVLAQSMASMPGIVNSCNR